MAPVTVYIAVLVGVTVIELVVAPVFQLYVVAPVPNNVADPPLQNTLTVEVIFTVGFGFTIRFTCEYPIQFAEVVADTE